MQKRLRLSLIGAVAIFFTLSAVARINDGKELSKHLVIDGKYGKAEIYIHGYERDKDFMTKVERVMLTDSVRLFDYFKMAPQDPVHIVIESEIHQANGMATGFPKNKMILYTYPPDADGLLLASDDWVRTLVLHELTHIIQADITSGIVGGLRDIFGSIFKWNLFTPRWFAEGSAVWAETHFTKGGRNRYIMNNLELDRYLLDPRSCQDISCLDEGAIYPYRGLAYSLGGKFMEYLENSKPGVISCMMHDNSDNIPFLLNNAFVNCFNQEIDLAFAVFIHEYRRSIAKTKSEFSYLPWASEGIRLNGVGKGELFFDKGMEIINDQLVFASYDHRIEFLNSYDLNSKKNTTVKLSDKLDSIATPTKASRRDQHYILGLYDLDGDDVTRSWTIVDKNLKSKTQIEEDFPSTYLFWLGNKNYLSLRYIKNQWWLYDQNGEFMSIEPFRTLSHPVVETIGDQDFLVYKSFYRGKFSLQVIELQSKSRKNLYLDELPFNFVGHYDGAFLINRPSDQSDKLLVLHLRQQSFVSKIEKANELARVRFAEDKVIYTHRRDPDGIYLYKGSPEQFLAWLRSDSSSYNSPKFLAVDSVSEKEDTKNKFTSYPKLSFFKPDYWFFNGIYSGTQKESAIYGSISDPMENHQLNFRIIHYGENNEVGGYFNYAYQLVDYTYLGLQGERLMHWSEARQKSESSENGMAYILANILTGRNSIPLTLAYGTERERNSYTGEREQLKTSTLSIGITHLPKFFDNFLNRFSLLTSVIHRDGEDLNYFTGSAQGQMMFYFNSTLTGHFSGMWERRYKDQITEGLSEFSQSFGPISGSDIFGNRLSYFDFNFEYLAKEVYRGWDNKPFFLRTISPVVGAEMIHAPYIYMKNKLTYDRTLTNAYAGIDFALRLGYMFDLSIRPVYGVLLNNGERSVSVKMLGEF